MGALADALSRLSHPGLLRWLRPAWLVIAGGAIAWTLAAYWPRIAAEPIPLAAMAGALSLVLAAKAFSAIQSRAAVTRGGGKLGWAEAFFSYAAADLAKYLPGGIWSLVGRFALYRRLGMSGRVVARAMLAEQLWLIGGAAAIGAALYLPARGGPALAVLPIAVWLGLLWATRRGGGVALLAFVQLGLWASAAASFAVLVPGGVALLGAGVFCLAFATGLAVPFAPGGIGVREGVGALLLLPYLDAGALARAVLISRCIWVVADLLFDGGALLVFHPAWRRATRDVA